MPLRRTLTLLSFSLALLVCAGTASGATRLEPLGVASIAAADDEGQDAGLPEHVTPIALYQRWIDRSLVPTPPGRVWLVLRPFGCAPRGTDACTEAGHPPRIIFTSGVYDLVSHYELLHELAHVFDFEVMTPRFRGRFMRIMHVHGNWWAGEAPPAEKFAMGYGYCAMSRGRPDYADYWGFGYHPAARQQRAVCRLIRAAARARAAKRRTS